MSQLHDPAGRRKYLTANEVAKFLEASKEADREVRTFCQCLAFTGCRITEALQLTADRIDLANRVLAADALLADGRAREAVAELRGIGPRSFIVGAALAGAAIAVGDWTLAEAAALLGGLGYPVPRDPP